MDLQGIGTWGLPESRSGYVGHTIVVAGRAPDGSYLVDDRGRAPFRIPPGVMAAARGRIGSSKNRITTARTLPGPIPAEALRAALRSGLEDQVDHLRSASTSFSLPAWRKWSRMMTDERDPKAWPRVFAGGSGLFGGLLAIVESVDAGAGPSGGHLRDLYAASLEEAAVALDLPGLSDAAAVWRRAADAWDELADAAVPPDVDGAADAVEALESLRDAVADGEPGRERVRQAADLLSVSRARHAASFPSDAARIGEIQRDLGARLAGIHAVETEAIEAMARAMGR